MYEAMSRCNVYRGEINSSHKPIAIDVDNFSAPPSSVHRLACLDVQIPQEDKDIVALARVIDDPEIAAAVLYGTPLPDDLAQNRIPPDASKEQGNYYSSLSSLTASRVAEHYRDFDFRDHSELLNLPCNRYSVLFSALRQAEETSKNNKEAKTRWYNFKQFSLDLLSFSLPPERGEGVPYEQLSAGALHDRLQQAIENKRYSQVIDLAKRYDVSPLSEITAQITYNNSEIEDAALQIIEIALKSKIYDLQQTIIDSINSNNLQRATWLLGIQKMMPEIRLIEELRQFVSDDNIITMLQGSKTGFEADIDEIML